MKKIIVATIAAIALQVSVSEAQISPTREVPVTKQNIELPPPPPPPPPAPPLPPANPNEEIPAVAPIPPVPPVPPVPPPAPVPLSPAEEYVGFTPPTIFNEINSIAENDKGYQISVRTVNKNSIVIIKKRGKEVKKISLETWLKNNDKYEATYGKLPPPPPPPPPPAPQLKNHS